MKEKKENKRSHTGLKVTALYAGLFGAALAAVYFGTPLFNGAYLSEDTVDDYGYTLSNTDKFMANLTEMTGLDATINSLSVQFPDNDDVDDTYNVVSLKEDSSLIVAMPDTDHIGFHLDTDVTLSTPNSSIADVTKSIYANYDNQDLYISVLGAKIKYLDEDYETVLTDLIDIIGEDNIEIPDEFYDIIDGIVSAIGGGDSSDEESSASFDISFEETSDSDSSVHEFVCEIAVKGLADDPLNFKIGMTSDDTFNLTGITIGEGDISINGIEVLADIDIVPNQTVTLTSLAPSDTSEYVSVVNFRGTLKKVANLVKAKKLGIEFEGALTHEIENGDSDDIAIDLDAAVDIGASDYRVALDIGNGSDTDASQSLQIAYLPEDSGLPQAAFLNYNGVLKLEMEQTTMDELIARIEDATSDSSGTSEENLDELSSLFSFITDSDVVKAIGEGHYQAVVEMVDDLKVKSDGTVIASLELEGLGFGDEAKIAVTASPSSSEKLLTIDISGITLSDFSFNGVLTIDEYFDFSFARDGYNDLKKLPDIYDQVESLANSRKFGLAVDADIAFGEEGSETEIALDGGLQMDLSGDSPIATASLTAGTDARKHLLKLDLNDADARLQYQDAAKTDEKGTLAKIDVSTISDIVDLVTEIAGDSSIEDASLATVASGLESVLGETALTQVLKDAADGRYSSIATLSLLSSYTFTDTESVFSINGSLFGLSTDPTFKIEYAASEEEVDGELVTKYSLSSAAISLAIDDVSADITLTLADYDDDATTSINGYEDSDFNDFSHVDSLARAAKNTVTELDSYHLKANAEITLWTADIIDLDIEFAATETDAGWEYYAKLSNIPLIPGVNSKYSIFFGYRRTVELVYKEETGLLYLSAENPFGKHGYSSDIAEEDRTDDNKIDWTETAAATYTSDYLSNEENLLKFILGDILNVQPYYLDQLSGSDATSDSSFSIDGLGIDFETLAYQNVLQSTDYDSATGEYDLTLDLAGLFDDADYVAKMELGVQVNNDNYLSNFGLHAYVFAGVRVDFELTASLIDPGEDLDDDVTASIADVCAAGEAGTAYTA